MKLVAIHQPNFFPWLGYFDKISRANIFVFLDDVAYPKSSKSMGSWSNRVRLNVGGQPRWIGCPLARYSGSRTINMVQIDESMDWRAKLIRTIRMNYARAPYFSEAMPFITRLIENDTSSLTEYNISAIDEIAEHLELRCQFVRQSELATNRNSTDLLVEIVKQVGGTHYLSGGGADGYQDDALFEKNGIGLIKQQFQPVPYGDTEKFMPKLSVIDYLMQAAG